MSKVEDFLTATEEAEVIEAIRTAEKNTSGEIRVHLEAHFNIDKQANTTNTYIFDRATQVFDYLQMHQTKNSNGVLIYVAVEDRTLVILGDKGINEVVSATFWESTKNIIVNHFKNDNIKQGLVEGILSAGKQLKKYFPYNKGDENELSDEISTKQ